MTDDLPPMLELRGLGRRYGAAEVLRGLDLAVPRGSFTVVVGPSGCGKSTLLRLIAGLDAPSAGEILIDGTRVDRLPPAKRGVSMVFQSYALYPHMTVRRNIGFGLKIAGASDADIHARIARAADMLKIGELMDRKPAQLSGGQRQRVAIARAIVRDPKVFLFDEPLSNLDAALRAGTRVELAAMHAKLGATIIHVTHDQVEAMTLADRLVVLNRGRIEQAGPPHDLYTRPGTLFVARFLGSPQMNVLTPASPTGQALARADDLPDGTAWIGIRPEDLAIAAPDAPDAVAAGRVAMIEELGDSRILHLRVDDGCDIVVRHHRTAPAPGSRIAVTARRGSLHPFAADERRLDSGRFSV
ncbi:ATP-binding cassette domain-containing protein [Tistrella mobilis]|uniref:ABC transporter ATP-binding protein n=1 Tax=Tistrella mobilis TaxID=171437 RepID=UPI003556CA18